MSIVIDDIYENIEFGVNIFYSKLGEKLENLFQEKIKCGVAPLFNRDEIDLIIEEAYSQSLNFISAEVHAFRDPPQWDVKEEIPFNIEKNSDGGGFKNEI